MASPTVRIDEIEPVDKEVRQSGPDSKIVASLRSFMTSFAGKNKDRLYIALYSRGGNSPVGPRNIHSALIVGPKEEKDGTMGTRHLVRPDLTRAIFDNVRVWAYECASVPLTRRDGIIARVLVRKLRNSAASKAFWERFLTFEKRGSTDQVSRLWIKATLKLLAKHDCLSVAVADWPRIEQRCRDFMEENFNNGNSDGLANRDGEAVPMLDMLAEQRNERIWLEKQARIIDDNGDRRSTKERKSKSQQH